MNRAIFLVSIFLLSLSAPLFSTVQADETDEMGVLHTAVNPANNNTYHLLSASSWEDAASYARSLDGFLVTVDDEAENTWLFDTFASWDNQSRHLWTGLSDAGEEGSYRWHDGTPFLYRDWGEDQPSEGGDEHYVHIASTNMGNIMPGTWNDLENDPQYFPVYGVVELGPGADYALRFDGHSDHVVMDHDDGLDMTNMTHLELSAWVHPYTVEGNQFIVMKGDYGWGLYLHDDQVAFSSEYSLSQHPVSNGTVEVDAWSHIQVSVVVGEGFTFHINGVEAGVVLDEDASIPLGDFGSNDCYETGLDCDELYLARMGAGCDCNHFEGVLDNITVRAGMNSSTMEDRIHIDFPEGEGSETWDASEERMASIEGADWVMPDGSIVAQAVELFVGEDYELELAAAGDTLLFFVEVEEYTRELYWYSYSFKFDDFEEATEYTLYAQPNAIPDEWNHDTESVGEWGFVYEAWSWPEVGVLWFTMILHTDIEDLLIQLDADMADPPPTLDDMTELKESIPVTNQDVNGNSFNNDGINMNYYYVNVTEPLADLRVRTYDGQGNVDIGISYYSPPTPTFWWEEPFEEDMANGKEDSVPELETWSTGPGNEEEVHLFDLEPGLYYITAYTFRNAREFTIVADFVYPPENVDPDDAITLTPGIEYGLLSGYEGLNQYFKVEVPQGTERLVVDLNDGAGDASLYMRLDQAPTTATYEHHSTAEGANDRIAFNDPTPGWWYILLTSESAFTGVNIVAEFADRYVWDYDGTPIELYNDEPLDGISVAKSGEISFFTNLEEPGSMLWLETYGGSGDIMLYIEGQQYEIEFSDGGGRPGPGAGFETVAVDFDMMSGKEGTNHMMSVESPLNGQIDITMTGISDAEEVSIVVRWDESDFPVEPIEPIAPVEPKAVDSCTDVATEIFEDADTDGDGVLDEREIKAAEIPADELKVIDVNQDGSLEYREVLQFVCSCDNELMLVFESFALGREEVSLKALEGHPWSNDYDFSSIDINDDALIDEQEIELLIVLCETTFDAFDGDGDGVPDVDDAFPEDPTESKDTDGDGVGDNADIVASVSNDIIYASAGAMFLILAGLLLGFLRTNRSSNEPEAMWDGEDRMTEVMFGQSSGAADYQKEEVALPDMPDSTPTQDVQASTVDDVFSIGQPIKQQPPSELMGMVLDGIETIEFPTGSGEVWVRSSPDDLWLPKE
ncbi:MAG: hypothetical protein DWC05_02320 [Candidatus Poseidoniales archaeon]|nr:MAG: hypothetical protein DWC05_02320 [Candidatus Poseidoniales archaeon]